MVGRKGKGIKMKSMMKRTTLREIRQSFGRFIAILAIIALGVGFYAGLSVSKGAMVQTTDHYLKQHTFFDYRLLSTLGFEEADVEAFAAAEDVAAAEGAYSLDVLYQNREGNESAIKLHSLPELVNTVELTAGRLPENASECVVDSRLCTKEDIGTKLILTDNNDEETLESLTGREFTIVGIVQSPYYMNFERGTTSLGNGKLTGYAYLSRDAFNQDYYTEVFLAFDQDYEIYSDAYEDFMAEKEEDWEALCQERADIRFASILDEANEELSDAEEELADQKAEAEKELNEAYTKLTDAQTELEDGQKSLDDARKSLKEQEDALAASRAGYMPEYDLDGMLGAQLEMAQAQINEAKKALAEKEEELTGARTELEDGWKEYDENKEEFDEKIEDAEQKLADAREEIDALKEPKTYVLGRKTNIGYACFESDSSIVAGISRVFPIFFFLVAALICITTMNRMVEEQRTQIGVLKALGYSNLTIMSKYLFYSGSAAIIGCILGFFVGTYGFPRVIWSAYGIMYDLVPLEYVLDGGLLAVSVVVALLCSVGTTWFSCRYELTEVAAQLMRPKAPKAGKRVFLEGIPFLWNRLKFLHKVSLRNIFRYKKRFLMMVIGISGCTALLVTGFGIKDSISNLAAYQYEEIMTFDGTANLSEPYEEDGTDLVTEEVQEWVEDSIYVSEQSMDLYADGKVKSVSLIVPKEQQKLSDFIDFHTKKKETVEQPGLGEAVINSKLSDIYKLNIGDELTLRDENMQELHVTVSGIFENYIYDYVFVSEETYVEQMGELPEYKSVYLKFKEGQDVHAAGAALAESENVSSVSVNADMKERIASMMSSLDYIVLTIIICAAFLAFIVLYNLTNINITERIREIATIKVLGFYKREADQYVFRENMLLTGIGALVGLVLGKLLHAFVMSQIQIDMIAFDVRIRPLSYCFSILLTFLFAWLVNRVMSVKVDGINMAESLKSVD